MQKKETEEVLREEYILSQLKDIAEKADLDDDRILVYCQPVYNTMRANYDTAEALMRLRLDKIGLVFPDQFIPLAEEYDYIHTMSLIILHKTCLQIKAFLEQGYSIKRISVNFSIKEFSEAGFCSDVKQVIHDSGIPHEKIAFEITESQDDANFKKIKEKIEDLQDYGITFYLDDFGSGYSNFLRIMELPFDIIKFDRSLVLAAMKNIKSETIVNYLAHMFSDMNYSVLYEGIETEQDEMKCIQMCAKYLQGYKYSKPIPIEQLEAFFEKTA